MKNKKSHHIKKLSQQIKADNNLSHCFHESGHVVAAWIGGLIISNVTITGPIKIEDPEHERSPCYCDLQHPGMVFLERITPEDVLSRITVALAPHAIEDKLTGEPSIGSLLDTSKVIRFLTWGSNPEIKSLIENAESSINNYPNDYKKAAENFFQACAEPAKKLINSPNTMEAISQLAEELNMRGRMSGYEAVKLLERSWNGPLPKKAKPAHLHPVRLKGEGLENTLAAALRLSKMAFEIIRECRPKNKGDETILEAAAVSVLGSVFKLHELSQFHIK